MEDPARAALAQPEPHDDAHTAFLLALSDRLRSLGDPIAIQSAATELLVEHIGAARCNYSDYDEERGIGRVVGGSTRVDAPNVRGVYELADFEEQVESLRTGAPLVIHDWAEVKLGERAAAFLAARQVRSQITVPLVKDGKLFATLSVNDVKARRWTDREVALVVETAERTWAAVERARVEAALRASEQLARGLLDQAMASRAEAEAANRAKDEFLAVLGHELRTPLAAILLWARALRTGAVGAADLARAIDAISQSAETQSRLIDDLLDLSRLTTGKLRLSRSSFDVDRVVQEAVDTVRHAAIAKGISLTTEIDDGVGVAVLDGTRLKQVLWNLLTNAVKFTPAGGEVIVRARRSEGQLAIDVSDTGEGIAPEFFPHLFEKFRQADMGEARPHMGLGIGLSLSKQLVELHGGTIEATSEGRGRGATFRVRVPCGEASAPASATSVRPGATERPSLAGLRLLLVEDDANTQSAMKWSLERAGASVTACTDGLEALAILEGDLEPDVIVSDLGLPGMSGLELIARVVAHYESRGRPPPPSCAVSAHAREVDRRGAIDAGFDAYLAKPITPERLVEVVADLRHVLASSTT